MLFSYRYSLTEKDFRNFNYYSIALKQNARKMRKITCIFIAAVTLFFLAAAIGSYDGVEARKWALITLILPSTAWLILRYLNPAFKMRKVDCIMAQNPVRFPVDSETTFLEDRFIDTSPDIRIEAAYHRIRGISVSKSGDIYLWIGSDFAFIIPAFVFSCDDERRALLGMLIAKTGIKVDDLYYR